MSSLPPCASQTDDSISLKPIEDLRGYSFKIPAYQRGYRWDKTQVLALLNDIANFEPQDNQGTPTFYFLQPIVVKHHADAPWEVIDGQQRLTTIHLILTSLDQSAFSLSYETRPDSQAYLEKPDAAPAKTIDHHFIQQMHCSITQWLKDDLAISREAFLQKLLHHTRVICYQLPHNANAVDAFTRLNVGKIPLSDAELIRALYLRRGKETSEASTNRQLQIAQEWDRMEKALRHDDFWYFLQGKESSAPSRIELLFKLIAKEDSDKPSHDQPHGLFDFYHARITPKTQEAMWQQIRQLFHTLEEWFHDRQLFHLIGYLIIHGSSILTLRNEGAGLSKSAFRRHLILKIFGSLISHSKNMDKASIETFVSGLEYGDPKVRSTLLLFNLSTMLRHAASNQRFSFDHYKNSNWDIEHVRSVASDPPQSEADQRKYLSTISPSIGTPFKARIDTLLSAKPWNTDAFVALYEELMTIDEGDNDKETENSIGNLALLDEGTNRSYKNAPFPTKRQRILELDQNGVFVPLCTRNVFLKTYSSEVDDMMRWKPHDHDSYQQEIIDTLTTFFSTGDKP
ncbi:uncharacterized protein with ParB-like and HNH nuclease domain [Prosthecobacter fusiformis]|uniref:Uncharacterized protein with ParB-like and HNH nuclease domain n=1 Tax=Prosthecobacter fusiformis TaxID=48464 RepID=A0A4R7RSG3_9BACT|nr:DUF262 domain-containing protein [Prosthecobacter fusiformis]TDU68069.1 uncharacterized protein with ParB-like and HNH nuclease domain [Prosthecobacter fusiformis]